MAGRRDDPPLLEMRVSLRVDHQQPGLIAALLDEGHHVGVPHSLDVRAVDLKKKRTPDETDRYLLSVLFFVCFFSKVIKVSEITNHV